MGLGPRLDLRQSQSLVMTPQLQQAIRLLALSNLEVEAFLAEELEKNPLLDAQSGELETGEDSAAEVQPATRDAEPTSIDRAMDGEGSDFNTLDVDLGSETFHHDSVADGGPALRDGLGMNDLAQASAIDGPDFDSFEADAPSLHDHLSAQAGLVFSAANMLIAQHLIDQIDDAGYLTITLRDVATRLGVALSAVEFVLAGIHQFEPTGVGARGLSECLALQAREADRYDPAMARLIENLDLLAQGRLSQLKRMCGVDDEDMSDMIKELRTYDPKPGLRFGGDRPQAVTPDLFVAKTKTGWSVELNAANLPRILVNRQYYAELSMGNGSNLESKAWLSDCLASANWLVKAMDQRQRTIIAVASEIVKHQESFFARGVAHLRPLTLRQVAESIGMHESTVSRVTSNKYLACARGTFELKFFFTSAIAASDGGESVSAEAVKTGIRALISAESADKILSDDTLVDRLNEQGFDIARRTVAKYREAMGIGSSVQRRRSRAIEARAA
jgi:RNA polymerase sigma-54 factor